MEFESHRAKLIWTTLAVFIGLVVLQLLDIFSLPGHLAIIRFAAAMSFLFLFALNIDQIQLVVFGGCYLSMFIGGPYCYDILAEAAAPVSPGMARYGQVVVAVILVVPLLFFVPKIPQKRGPPKHR